MAVAGYELAGLGIGTKVEELIAAKGLSHEQFARLVGVHRSTIYRWLEPDFNPDAERLARIAKALEVRVGHFFGEIDKLLEKPPRYVAAHESLRLYLATLDLPEGRRRNHALWGTVDLTDAPTTVGQWRERDAFLRKARGQK